LRWLRERVVVIHNQLNTQPQQKNKREKRKAGGKRTTGEQGQGSGGAGWVATRGLREQGGGESWWSATWLLARATKNE
jgi:hypothetical protein